MTTQEFSNEFDVLYNNIMSNKAPGLDEYEKSIFLTLAQEALVTELYNSFENNEAASRYLNNLVTNYTVVPDLNNASATGIPTYSVKLPKELMYIVYENAFIDDNGEYRAHASEKKTDISVVTLDSLPRIYDNPFKGPSNKRTLRINSGNDNIELITMEDKAVTKYNAKYIRRPNPIILTDLDSIDSEISINGITSQTECELDSTLHIQILTNAVTLAKQAFVNNTR